MGKRGVTVFLMTGYGVSAYGLGLIDGTGEWALLLSATTIVCGIIASIRILYYD